MKKKVCIIGLGYIGLPTAALLAKNNFEVIGVDINKKTALKLSPLFKIDTLFNHSRLTFYPLSYEGLFFTVLLPKRNMENHYLYNRV